MIYDRILEVFDLDTASSPLARRLVLRAVHFCAPVTVYHRTYYESLQAGQTVDLMVRIPDPFGTPPAATQYAVPGTGTYTGSRRCSPPWTRTGAPWPISAAQRGATV